MAYTASLPTWNKVGVAPIAAKQTAGWGVNEHPPADWFNWQWNLTFLALQELQTNAIHKDGSGTFTGQIKSTLATGTAPLSVASTTLVANLNADMVDGFQAQAAYAINTVPVRDASGDLTTRRFISNVATGTAPFGVTSTTVVPNLNVDQVDGFHMDQDVRIAASPTHVRVTLSQATGTAPLTVASTTLVTNLNADMADGFHFDQDVRIAASPTFVRATFSQATGTAPFTVTSTTKVANLNADQVDGLDTATAATVNTIAARDASANLTANVLVSTVAIGTAPLTVTSTTVVPNLNADTTDGWHMNQDVRTTASPTFVTPTVARLISTQATGTAPFTVASQTIVTNLNADQVDGFHADTAATVNTVAARDASGDITARRFVSGLATGTSPLSVTSTTVNANLNADMADGFHFDQDVRTTASPTFVTPTVTRLTLTQATGTAPLTVTSTTVVTNLNADTTDGFHMDQDVRIAASPTHVRVILSQTTGTAPLTITSTTLVANLNADMVDGFHLDQDVRIAASPTFVKATFSQATGTAPFTVTSTTVVTNLNADKVDGFDFNQSLKTTDSPTFSNVTLTTLLRVGNATINGLSHGFNRDVGSGTIFDNTKGAWQWLQNPSNANRLELQNYNSAGVYIDVPFYITPSAVVGTKNNTLDDGAGGSVFKDIMSFNSPTENRNAIFDIGYIKKRVGDFYIANSTNSAALFSVTEAGAVYANGGRLWGDNTTDARSGVTVSLSSSFTITSANVMTKLPFNSKALDNLSEFDTSLYRFTIKVSGKYRITTRIALTNATAGARLITALYKNGSQAAQLAEGFNYSGSNIGINGGTEISLNAGDYIEFYGFSTMANAVVDANGVLTYLSITRIA